MIKKVKGGYQVVSSEGKNLGGPYKTLESAKKRLRTARPSVHSPKELSGKARRAIWHNWLLQEKYP